MNRTSPFSSRYAGVSFLLTIIVFVVQRNPCTCRIKIALIILPSLYRCTFLLLKPYMNSDQSLNILNRPRNLYCSNQTLKYVYYAPVSSVCCCLLRGPRPFFGDGSAASPPTAVLFIPKPYVPDTISEKHELNNAHYYSEYFICLLFISLFAHTRVQNSSRSKTYFLSTEITLNIKCHCLTISNTKLTFITIQLEQQTSYTLLYFLK